MTAIIALEGSTNIWTIELLNSVNTNNNYLLLNYDFCVCVCVSCLSCSCICWLVLNLKQGVRFVVLSSSARVRPSGVWLSCNADYCLKYTVAVPFILTQESLRNDSGDLELAVTALRDHRSGITAGAVVHPAPAC